MTAKVANLPVGHTKNVQTVDYPIASVNYRPIRAKVDQSLPFRVRLTNITISAYGPSNPPPVGIAVIGFNNYIL